MRDPGRAIAWLAPVALLLAACTVVADPPFPAWDEGVHLADAIDTHRVLTGGSLKALLLHLDAPMQYPFLHGLLVAIAWCVTGVGEAGARVVSLLTVVALVPALALLARRVLPPKDVALALPVAAALLLSGADLSRLMPQIMLDIPGTALTTVAIAAWLYWLERASWTRAALTVVAVLAAFFTKFNYGIILGAALLVHGVLARAGLRRLTQATVLMGLPVLLWLYQEPAKKMAILSTYLWNRTIDKTLLTQLTLPLLSLVRDHAVTPLMGLAVVTLWIWRSRRTRLNAPAGILLLFPIVQLAALAAASSAQLARYLLPAMPLVVLGAAGALAAWAGERAGRRLVVAGIALATAVPALLDPAHALRQQPSWAQRGELRALDQWVREQHPQEPLLLIGGFNEYPPSMGRFSGVVRFRGHQDHVDLDAPPLFLPPPRACIETGGPLLPVLPREALAILAATEREIQKTSSVVPSLLVLKLAAESSFRGFDFASYNAWQEVLIAEIERTRGTPAVAATFEHGHLTARIYRPRAPDTNAASAPDH